MRLDQPIHMKRIAFTLFLVAACAGSAGAGRLTSSVSSGSPGALSVFRSVTAAEIPSVASRWVSQAAADQREGRALEAIKAVVSLSKPGLLPYVVTAVSQAAPSAAPRVAAEAAALAPDFALAATKAAIAAAPAEVERIVAAVCRQVPELAAGVGVEIVLVRSMIRSRSKCDARRVLSRVVVVSRSQWR